MRTKTLEGSSAQDFAGFQVDLIQKLRSGNMSYDQILWFKGLTFEQREELMGKPLVQQKEYSGMKLINSNVVVVGLKEELNFDQYFTKNNNVKYYMSDDFEEYVLNGTKTVNSLPDKNFSKFKFLKTINDFEIIVNFKISNPKKLMTQEQILWTIAVLTSKQSKGEAGILLTNGRSTVIGYLYCIDCVVRVVKISYNFGGNEWWCFCEDIDSQNAGDVMLFPNK